MAGPSVRCVPATSSGGLGDDDAGRTAAAGHRVHRCARGADVESPKRCGREQLTPGRRPALRQNHRVRDDPLPTLRSLCLALPETTERLSHDEATWFIRGKKTFAMYADHHHDDRLAMWCAAPRGAQETLLPRNRSGSSARPTSGHRGWLGIVEQAYRVVLGASPPPRRTACRTSRRWVFACGTERSGSAAWMSPRPSMGATSCAGCRPLPSPASARPHAVAASGIARDGEQSTRQRRERPRKGWSS